MIKELLQLVESQSFVEFRIKLLSEIGMLGQLERLFNDFDHTDYTATEKEEIDEFRYLIGHEMEHYLLLRLNRKNRELVKFLQNNTKYTEWVSTW